MKHVRDKIQACLDGELTPAEAAAVRAHCESCDACGRIWHESEAVWRAVAEAPPPPLNRSLWPGVQTRLAPRSPWPRLAFAGGAVAVALVGLLGGLWFGGALGDGARSTAMPSLLEEGVLLVEGAEPTFDLLYLAAGLGEEEVTP
jgi:anti-sigma factor RsiW